jgi:hypothetical protein
MVIKTVQGLYKLIIYVYLITFIVVILQLNTYRLSNEVVYF